MEKGGWAVKLCPPDLHHLPTEEKPWLSSEPQSHLPPYSQCPLTARTHHVSGHGVLCGPPRAPGTSDKGAYSPPGAASQRPLGASQTQPVFFLCCTYGVKNSTFLWGERPPPEHPGNSALSVCSLTSASPSHGSPSRRAPTSALLTLCPLSHEQCLSLSMWRTMVSMSQVHNLLRSLPVSLRRGCLVPTGEHSPSYPAEP